MSEELGAEPKRARGFDWRIVAGIVGAAALVVLVIQLSLKSKEDAAIASPKATVAASASTAYSYSEPAPVTSVAMPAGYYRGNGEFAVEGHGETGLPNSIPPGRYLLTVTPGGAGVGSFMRCHNVLCGLAYPQNALSVDNALTADYSSVVEIEPSDIAVWMQGVTLREIS